MRRLLWLLAMTACTGVPDGEVTKDPSEPTESPGEVPALAGLQPLSRAGGAEERRRSLPVQFGTIPPLYVGAWARVPVIISPTAGYGFDDLTFEVVGGPAGGQVSMSKDDTFNPAEPTVMLLGGWLPGTYTLRALKDGAFVASRTFQITVEWNDPDRGPPLWLHGDTDPDFQQGAASVVGEPGATGVQNFNVQPRSGNWHVVLLFVDFADTAHNPATVAARQQVWMDHTVNGALDKGQLRSAAGYWSEVSGGLLTLSAEVAGPVQLTKTFAEYCEGDWKKDLAQPALTAAIQAGIDLSDADVVVFVQPTWVMAPLVCTPSNGGVEICDGLDNDCDGDIDSQGLAEPCTEEPSCGDGVVDGDEECDDGNALDLDYCTTECKARTQHFAWPQATLNKRGPFVLANGLKRKLALISMPEDWTNLDGRQIYETLAHEIGHSLGLGDEYTPDVPDRNLDDWDIMARDRRLPHLTLSQRLRLGWVHEDDVFSFNPATLDSAEVELDAIGELTAYAGRYLGLEFRIANDWNLYLEYRLHQPGHMGDAENPIPQTAPGVVLATDRRDIDDALARPPVLTAAVMPDSAGPALGVGDVYNWDVPDTQEVRVEVLEADGNKARVSVDYGTFRPDPSIRRWNPPPYKSPDIWVKNEKSLADPENWDNVPWAGEKNTIVARVANDSLADAPGVEVQFFVKNFNLGGVPGEFLGATTVDLAAGEVKEVECVDCWQPPKGKGHYCIQVRIPLYQNPNDLTEVEMTDTNNMAQSNYKKFWSGSASPAQRVGTTVHVGSVYPERAHHLLAVQQAHPDFRTYLDARWVTLEAGEIAEVDVMHEFAEDLETYLASGRRVPTAEVHIDAAATPPGEHDEERTEVPLDGVTIDVEAGFRTRIDPVLFRPQPARFEGTVLATGGGAVGGRVLVRVEYEGAPAPRFFTGQVTAGTFSVGVDEGPWVRAEVHYLGDSSRTPCEVTVTP